MTRHTWRRCAIVTLLATAVWGSGVGPAAAQSDIEPWFGYRGLVDVGPQIFAAPDTFNAILGTEWGTFVGGGGQARWKNLLFEVTGSQFKDTGERVFISDGEVFHLGIPTTITIRPIEFTAAYRLPALWRFRPYGGGGFGKQRYKETSTFAQPSEDFERTDTTYHAVGGAEIRLWRWIGAGAEVRYRSVRDAIGEGGVSKEYGEDDLGGTSIRFRVIVIGR
jgi:opacity protein-like surface antigen